MLFLRTPWADCVLPCTFLCRLYFKLVNSFKSCYSNSSHREDDSLGQSGNCERGKEQRGWALVHRQRGRACWRSWCATWGQTRSPDHWVSGGAITGLEWGSSHLNLWRLTSVNRQARWLTRRSRMSLKLQGRWMLETESGELTAWGVHRAPSAWWTLQSSVTQETFGNTGGRF